MLDARSCFGLLRRGCTAAAPSSVLDSEIQCLQPINSWRLQSFRNEDPYDNFRRTFKTGKRKRRNVSGTKTATMRWTKALRMPIQNSKQMELAVPDKFILIVSPRSPSNFFQLTFSVQRVRRYHTSRASLLQIYCSTKGRPHPRPRLP